MLTNQGDECPDWSPDGSKIVFDSYRDGNLEIYVMNADGSSQTRLTNNAFTDYDPAWSPDGSKIVFTSWGRSLGQIYVMNPDGTGQTNLSNNPFRDEHPNWGPVAEEEAVGGTLMPVNWLMILAPYLALVGILGAVVVAVATKRRRRA
jgi:dipeptidyl aminopeptidase/acylaminoacyl peptidase